MHRFATLLLVCFASAYAASHTQVRTFKHTSGLDEKHDNRLPEKSSLGTLPSTIFNSCAHICGEGYQICKQDDFSRDCFNLADNDVCCDSRKSCSVGTSCIEKDGQTRCCQDGPTLGQRQATASLMAVPGISGESPSTADPASMKASIQATTTKFTTEQKSTTAIPLRSTSTPRISTSTSRPGATLPSYPQPSDYHPYSPSGYGSSTSETLTKPTPISNSTNVASQSHTPTQQTTNAGSKVEFLGWGVCGFFSLMMGFLL